jgi:hypothetical protein
LVRPRSAGHPPGVRRLPDGPGEASPDRLLRDAADALVWAITALVEGKGQGSGWLLDPSDLTRPNAWAIGNEGLGLAGAPHLYTDH